MTLDETPIDNTVAQKEANSGSTSEDDEGQFRLQHVETYQTTYEQALSGDLYRDGELVLQPAATRAPCDPMNLPLWRKILGVAFLSMFGAMAASAEIILGAMLPVFVLQYSPLLDGVNPGAYLQTIVETTGGFTEGVDSLTYLEDFEVDIFKVYLLAALPILMIGVSNLILIPTAIAVGRRPVIIASGLIAIAGACWAGGSGSLDSHIGARCIQAIGAGTVESLIPFIIQDIIHVHKRNTWISAAFACQGVIIIAIGFSAPYIVVNLSWRWIYYITSICAAFFLTGVILFLPETRWSRTRSEMNGVPRDDENVLYPPRTIWYDLALFHGKQEWKKGWYAFIDVIRTFFYPHIFFVTLLNSGMIACAFAASYVTAPALLTQPWSWPFLHLGFCLVPVLIAAILVALITGTFADAAANWVAKRRGRRLPENQLINLILPALCGIVGSILFGLAGDDEAKYPWPVFLLSLGLIAFGFLGANSIGAVYVLECFPHLAGPALVNIAAFRCIIAFFLTFEVSNLTLDIGYLKTFSIFTAIIGFFTCIIPIIYIFGPTWRAKLPGLPYGEKNANKNKSQAELEKEAEANNF